MRSFRILLATLLVVAASFATVPARASLGTFAINHPVDNSFTLTLQSSFGTCNAVGNYSQLGHMGTVDANYSCTYGVSGTMTLYELERTGPGMTGRFVADNNLCFAAGTLGGVER